MKIIFLLQTFILANIVFGHKTCNFKRTPKDLSILERLKENQDRNLVARVAPQQMRIKYDCQRSSDKGIFNKKTVQYATQFYHDLIKVKQPINAPFKISEKNKDCKEAYNFSKIQMNTEYKDVDLVLFVTHVHDPFAPYIAYATGCQQDQNTGRYIIGMINFNTGKLKPYTEFEFQQQLETAIHELFHVLVFDKDLFQFFTSSNGNLYDKSQYNTSVLKTPHVAKWVQNYYGCKTAEGMQLEDNGGSGSAGAHWEKSILYEDIMTAAVYAGLWSGVNNALLLDSGWYDVDLKFEDNHTWGKNKGCEFLQKDKCKSDKQFKEFCKGKEQDITFNYNAKGKCKEQFSWEPECGVVLFNITKVNGVQNPIICYDPSNFDPNGKYNEYYGYDSKAFLSTLKPKSEKPITQACYKYKCTNDNTKIEVTFGHEILTCRQNGEQLKSSSNQIDGYLTCPDIRDFCGKQTECPNHCGANGYCISGKCVCQNGFSGDACQCEEGKVNSYGQCVGCGENCTVCNSADPKKCSACKIGFFLSGEKCLPCKSPCKTCSTAQDTCLSCISNYYLSNTSCQQFTSDSNCDVPEDNLKCKICKSGKGLDSNGKCSLTCSRNCKTCSQKADVCTSCNDGNLLFNTKCVCQDGYFMNQNNECEKCMAFCKECVNAQTCIQCTNNYLIDQNTKKCSICPKGSFFENGKCEKCSDNCEECQGSSTNCTKCYKPEILFGQIGSQQCKCLQNFVYNSQDECTLCTIEGCSKCEKENICSECDPKYQLDEKKNICILARGGKLRKHEINIEKIHNVKP